MRFIVRVLLLFLRGLFFKRLLKTCKYWWNDGKPPRALGLPSAREDPHIPTAAAHFHGRKLGPGVHVRKFKSLTLLLTYLHLHLQGGRDGTGGEAFVSGRVRMSLTGSAHMGATRNPEKDEWTYSEE